MSYFYMNIMITDKSEVMNYTHMPSEIEDSWSAAKYLIRSI
jgi:hypothetical protein